MNQLFDWLTACPLQWGCLFLIFFLIPFMFITLMFIILGVRTASHSEYRREEKERRYYWMQDCKDLPTEVERKKLERIRKIALMNCINKDITGNNKKRWWKRGKTKFLFPL